MDNLLITWNLAVGIILGNVERWFRRLRRFQICFDGGGGEVLNCFFIKGLAFTTKRPLIYCLIFCMLILSGSETSLYSQLFCGMVLSVVDNSRKDRGESVKKCAKMRTERSKRSGG